MSEEGEPGVVSGAVAQEGGAERQRVALAERVQHQPPRLNRRISPVNIWAYLASYGDILKT